MFRKKPQEIIGKNKRPQGRKKEVQNQGKAKRQIELGARANAVKVFKQMKRQFGDPNKCYRELVQNAMDAGTDRLEFSFHTQKQLSQTSLENYLHLFEERISTLPQEAQEQINSLEELLVSENGHSSKLAKTLGKAYHSHLTTDTATLTGELKREYRHVVRKDWKIEAKNRAFLDHRGKLNIEQNGLCRALLENIQDPLQKIQYLDQLIEWNVRSSYVSRTVDETNKLIEPLIEHRYELLARLVKEHPENKEISRAHKEKELWFRRKIKDRASRRPYDQMLTKREEVFLEKAREKFVKSNTLSSILKSAPTYLEITARDYGRGMTHADRKEFLTRIFSSSKADDLEQTGRFGVGFVSIFGLNPERVIVKSTRAGEAWEYHFLAETNDSIPGELYIPKTPLQKGTEIKVLIPNLSAKKADAMIQAAEENLKRDCRHVERPILINGVKINTEPDLPDCPVKVQFGRRGIEGIIGITRTGPTSYRLENNRINLEEKQAPLFGSDLPSFIKEFRTQIIVSSKYINYNIARENVVRDANFTNILRLAEAQEDVLAEKVFDNLAAYFAEEIKPPKEEVKLWSAFASHYLYVRQTQAESNRRPFWAFRQERYHRNCLRKLIPTQIGSQVLVQTVKGDLWSLDDLLEYTANNNNKELLFAPAQSDATRFAREKEQLEVFKRIEKTHPTLNAVLKGVFDIKMLDKRYTTEKTIKEADSAQGFFIKQLEEAIQEAGLNYCIQGIYLGRLSNSKPFEIMYADHAGNLLRNTSWKGLHVGMMDRIDHFTNNVLSVPRHQDYVRALAIDPSHPYTKTCIEYENLHRNGVAAELYLQAAAGYMSIPPFTHLKSTLKQWKKNGLHEKIKEEQEESK